MEFPGGDIPEFAANSIAESMYAQFDVGGSEYLLLETFINHRKNDSAPTEGYQKVVVKGRGTIRKSMAG